jgi:hypothetical protein
MANVSLERKFSLNNPNNFDLNLTINELNVQGLPSLMYWIRLDTPILGVRWSPLFSVTNVTTGGVTAPNWLPFTNGFILVSSNVTTFFVRAAVGVAGMGVTLPAGAGVVDVTTVITAGG